MFIKHLVISLLVSSCASQYPSKRVVDAELEPYVQRFEAILGKQIAFQVKLDVLDIKYVGMCTVAVDGSRFITISNTYWDTLTEGGKEQTVFHELGHCELNRGHINTCKDGSDGSTGQCEYSGGGPVSIMYYMEFGDQYYYTQNRDSYVAELFKNGTARYMVHILETDADDFKHE